MAKTKSNNSKAEAESLKARLAEREQLVEELTSRLEQAAEQLDRLNRTGADRGARINNGGGLPPELIEQQHTLTGELQEAVRNWENMQPTVLLSRVEMQIGELRDLMFERSGTGAPPVHKTAPTPAAPVELPGAQPPPPSAGDTIAFDGSDASELSIYERFKAGLDGESPVEESAAEPTDAVETATEESAAPAAPPRPEEPEIPAVDPPAEIDLAAADEDELRAAVDARDTYISYLLRRLRAKEIASWPAGEWKDLEGVPGELAVRLEEYEKQLEELLRMAEVETSLERARLGREAAKLEMERQQIQTVMSHLKLDAESESEDDDSPNGDGKSKPSRLKRFLARWQGDDE